MALDKPSRKILDRFLWRCRGHRPAQHEKRHAMACRFRFLIW